MNTAIMEVTGTKYRNISWSDVELSEQILALDYVIAYLKGREDSGIVLSRLRIDRDMFTDMQEARHRR